MGMCGIIFDLDGVLCYTDHYHYLAWKAVADITVTTGYLDIGFYCSSLGGTTVHIDNVKILNK